MTRIDGPVSGTPARVALVDAARGAALAAMIVYHTAWDLSFLGLIETNIREVPAWTLFARAIAASFLALVGVGLWLAHQRGWNRRSFFKRLVRVAGAALLVTIGTYVAIPANYVLFGILHAIAVCSILALPFLRMPALVVALFAVLALILPMMVSLSALSSPWLVWLGLGTDLPVTNDFVPVFPWIAFVLLGMAAAKAIDFNRWSGFAGISPPAHLLALAGRNSLVIYLLHQPILFGTLALAAMTLGSVDRDTQAFQSSCQSQCKAAGGAPARCVDVCACTADALKAEGIWAAVLANRMDEIARERVGTISRTCAGSPGRGAARP